jgi:hypothetical protein
VKIYKRRTDPNVSVHQPVNVLHIPKLWSDRTGCTKDNALDVFGRFSVRNSAETAVILSQVSSCHRQSLQAYARIVPRKGYESSLASSFQSIIHLSSYSRMLYSRHTEKTSQMTYEKHILLIFKTYYISLHKTENYVIFLN